MPKSTKLLMKKSGEEKINIMKSFENKTIQELLDFLIPEEVHCLVCKDVFEGTPEVWIHKSDRGVKLEDHKDIGVPYLICPCGYKSSLLKLLNQF